MSTHIEILLPFILATITQSQVITYTEQPKVWGYGEDNGPDTWTPSCTTNTSHRQSPLDVSPSNVLIRNIGRIFFVNYNNPGDVTFANNGHTIIVDGFQNWKDEQPYIYGGDLPSRYRLVQLHMHWSQVDSDGSEHTLGLLHYPAEVHLVHLKDNLTLEEATKLDDGIAVVAIFVTEGNDDEPYAALEKNFAKVRNVEESVTLSDYVPNALLPKDRLSFYRYMGSLTTPNCAESVLWTVMADPISITRQQLTSLRQMAGHDGIPMNHNNRPVQKPYGRKILFRPSDIEEFLALSNSKKIILGFETMFCFSILVTILM